MMDLPSEYRKQFGWRAWTTAIGALPSVTGQTILDFGCGVGDLAAALVARGAARVVGLDFNDELIRHAESRGILNAEFRLCDLRDLPDLELTADGIWCSFTASYFPDLPVALTAWQSWLKPDGWVALTEIDDLFGHRPLSDGSREMLNAYADHALQAGWYDFHMGRKLATYARQSGLTIANEMKLEDSEFSFTGSGHSDVVAAWRMRFDRMKRLQRFCGADFEVMRKEFLDCLVRPDHQSDASVCLCIARLS